MTDEPTGRFRTEHDTPCPFRMARFGYARTGEFRAPKEGELYIVPTDNPYLGEDEPHVEVAVADTSDEPRHLVRAISEEEQAAIADPLLGLLMMLSGGLEPEDAA